MVLQFYAVWQTARKEFFRLELLTPSGVATRHRSRCPLAFRIFLIIGHRLALQTLAVTQYRRGKNIAQWPAYSCFDNWCADQLNSTSARSPSEDPLVESTEAVVTKLRPHQSANPTLVSQPMVASVPCDHAIRHMLASHSHIGLSWGCILMEDIKQRIEIHTFARSTVFHTAMSDLGLIVPGFQARTEQISTEVCLWQCHNQLSLGIPSVCLRKTDCWSNEHMDRTDGIPNHQGRRVCALASVCIS